MEVRREFLNMPAPGAQTGDEYGWEKEMIVYADRSMEACLKEMWKQCFGDDDSYIDFYFQKRFREDNMIVYLTEDGKPASMLSLLPAELILGGGRTMALRYIYAGATFPCHQKKGCYGSLLKYAVQSADAAGEAVMLVPADESLREYYKKKGFTDAFRIYEKSFESGSEPDFAAFAGASADGLAVSGISPEEYKKLRDAVFCREGDVRWDMEAVRYAAEETCFCGGSFSRLVYRGKEYAALYSIENKNHLYIKEITALGKEAEDLVFEMALYFRAGRVKALLAETGNAVLAGTGKTVPAEIGKAVPAETGNAGYPGREYAMVQESLAGMQFGYFNLALG